MNGADRSLGTRRWPELAGDERPVLAVPVGSFEQHGPHLPLDTDTRIAVELCRRLADRRAEVLLGPPVAVGASGEHAGFPGTLSIGTEVLTQVIVELLRSADWADGVVVVNGHGGNHEATGRAAELLEAEGRSVMWWWPTWGPGTDAHAGRTETSVMLALAPELVGPERPLGRTDPIGMLIPELRRVGVAPVAPNGVLGDATGADAAEGARLLDVMTADLDQCYLRWRTTP
jgi:mycofactocin precursor peptide peptidase